MLALVVLAAGRGSRMKSELPKVLHPVLGSPLLDFALEKGEELAVDESVVVVGWGREAIEAHYEKHHGGGTPNAGRKISWAVQDEQLGTGHAAHIGVEAISAKDAEGVLILNGDLPLLDSETIRRLVETHRENGHAATVLTCHKDDPTGFGRVVRAESGQVVNIVEEPDCDDETRAIPDVNVGTYVFSIEAFRKYYDRIGTDNEQNEYYLTDVVVEASKDGAKVGTVAVADERETAQVNCQKELAVAQAILKERIIDELFDKGVRIDDPASCYIERGVEVAAGAHIHPFCVLRKGTVIEAGAHVGPFAHLRPGSHLGAGSKVGNFCELKNTDLGPGAKVNHLSYVGDGDVGAQVNIGAGTIFANYDGKKKHRTVVKDGAFIGSGTVLVAPVTVGEGASTGAGSVVLRGRDVEDGQTVVGMPAQVLENKSLEKKTLDKSQKQET